MKNIVEKAKQFAYSAHKGQKRKGKDIPFTNHLDLAVKIGNKLTDDENIISAIWLHDTVEDTMITLEDIKSNFNNEIYEYVKAETEIKEEDEIGSWKKRKINQINILKEEARQNPKVLYIAFSDKLANLLEMKDDYFELGEQLFNRFNNHNKLDHYWYYNEFYKMFKESNLFTELQLNEYKKIIKKIFL